MNPAPVGIKRKPEKVFRVDVKDGVHARASTGGSIALAQSHVHPIEGKLPNGESFAAQVRVTRTHSPEVRFEEICLDNPEFNGVNYVCVVMKL